jgi:hypothetical protein
VREAPEPERHPLDPLDQIVQRLGRPVGDVCSVPGGDLMSPAQDGAAELADFGRTRFVLQIGTEPSDELEREVRVVVVIDRADHLLRVSRGAHLVAGIAGAARSGKSTGRGIGSRSGWCFNGIGMLAKSRKCPPAPTLNAVPRGVVEQTGDLAIVQPHHADRTQRDRTPCDGGHEAGQPLGRGGTRMTAAPADLETNRWPLRGALWDTIESSIQLSAPGDRRCLVAWSCTVGTGQGRSRAQSASSLAEW